MNNPSELKVCPNCNNVGWYVVADENGEPEQVQCQFCYTEPNSVFNAINALNEQIMEQGGLIHNLFVLIENAVNYGNLEYKQERLRSCLSIITTWKEKNDEKNDIS